MAPSVVIWGASGHAAVVIDAIRAAGHLSIVGLLDDDPRRKGESVQDTKILGGRDMLAELRSDGVSLMHVAVGNCSVRIRLAELAQAEGFGFASVVHPGATLAANVVIGDGTFAAAGVVVNPRAHIGKHTILNTACSIDHDCVLGDACHIGPGARVAGQVHVGRSAWLGIGAIVKDRVRIGERTIVGAGAVVIRDLPSGVVAYGVPARVMREAAIDE